MAAGPAHQPRSGRVPRRDWESRLDLSDLIIAFVAVAIGAFVKGVTGSGLPLLGIPVMASFLGVEHAVAVIVIPSTVSNGWIVWVNRRESERARHLLPLVAMGVVGVVIGTWVLVSFTDRWLSLALAAMIIVYAVVFLTRPDLEFSRRLTDRANGPVGLTAGVLQGATGISAPVLATYLHGMRMDRETYLFTLTGLYGFFGVIQIVALAGLGSFTVERIVQGVAALVPMALALPAGIRVSRAISRRAFDLSVLAVLLALAVKLIFDAFGG